MFFCVCPVPPRFKSSNIRLLRRLALFLSLCCPVAFAATGGSISGTVLDSSGAVVPAAEIHLVSSGQRTSYQTVSDRQGLFSFPNLPVGAYDLTASAKGFASQRKLGLAVHTASALRIDITLSPGEQADAVIVTADTPAQVDTVSTQLGIVVSGAAVTSLPLNGRSYTDLLALQPGVAPISTLLPSSVVMAGVTGSLDPSGDLNPGNLSISGQRESSNGFFVDGIDVQEHMNGGTSVIPNLDSIDQFRVLTNNFDPEYGNYNGGMVTVITKSGSDAFHGNAFEFFRNTALDARGYFDPERAAFRQHQFGGTLGGPIEPQKVYFFGDYQGTRTNEGEETGEISVPTLAERAGNFVDPNTQSNVLTGKVSGASLASLLTQELGHTVRESEPYSAVFPNGVIPQRAWSAPARNLIKYIVLPNNGSDQFSTSAYPETVRDDKASSLIDAMVARWGQFFVHYFFGDDSLDNPYPEQQGGASVPGFDALTFGRAQLVSLADTKVFGSGTVNEFHMGYLRNANVIGQPKGGLGVSLPAQGFVTSTGAPSITAQAPQIGGVENIVFPSFVMGVPITNEAQVNNTLYLSDTVSKLIGSHTLKVGGQFHWDQVNDNPNA